MKFIFFIFIIFSFYSCVSYYSISKESLIEQIKNNQNEDVVKKMPLMMLTFFPAHSMSTIECFDKKNDKSILLVPNRDTKFIITHKKTGKKFRFYTASVVLKNDTLFGLYFDIQGAYRGIYVNNIKSIKVKTTSPRTVSSKHS